MTTAQGPSLDLGEKGILAVPVYDYYPVSYEPQPYSGTALSFVAYHDAKHHDPKRTQKNIENILHKTGAHQHRNDQLPEFIWIPDVTNPASTQIVPGNKFQEIIGPGIRLLGVSVEIATDSPDNSLYSKLPWLAGMEREQFGHLIINSVPFKLNPTYLLGELRSH